MQITYFRYSQLNV